MSKLLRPRLWRSALAVSFALCALSAPSRAGTQATPNGLADFLAGVLPPPGSYWLNYLAYVNKDKLMDEDGDEIKPAKLKASAFVEAARFVWMTPHKFLGATWGAQVIIPAYYADAEANTPNGRLNDNSKGLGDIIVNPIILAWHFSPHFHMGAGLDVVLPTGQWDSDTLSSTLLAKNVYTFEPLVAVSYWRPGGIDLSAKVMYDFHTRNKDTETTPGQEFHFDWGASYGFGGGDEFRAGLAGFVYYQTTPDNVRGEKADSSTKSRQFAAGPAFKWWPKMGPLSVTAKALKEFGTRNDAEGYSVWLDSVLAF